MLLPENIHPEKTLMYNGVLIIKALKTTNDAELIDLYLNANRDGDMSMALFVLSLDWLFLADCVKFSESGQVMLCS